jgi:hypothetical protein
MESAKGLQEALESWTKMILYYLLVAIKISSFSQF